MYGTSWPFARRASGVALACAALAVPSACVVGTDFEPEPFEANLAPLIDTESLEPANVLVPLGDDSTITLSAGRLLDPNPEANLSVIWLGSRSGGLFGIASPIRQSDSADFAQNSYFRFEGTSIVVSRCSIALAPLTGFETITLYVSDREIQSGDNDNVVLTSPGGYVVTRSWTIELGGSCND